MNKEKILNIVDRHLQLWIEKGLNAKPGKIEPEMADVNESTNTGEWRKWHPIQSTVTDTELEVLETQLKFKLPFSYKEFLKHKHFYELYISEARFYGQEIRNWRIHLLNMAYEAYPQELLIEKGYIPFADWNDWGLLCFDTNKPAKDYEYPIVLWDHERRDEFEEFSENFNNLIVKLDTLNNTSGS